eukprot:3045177-Alexandrium_andersonii.AAC.1
MSASLVGSEMCIRDRNARVSGAGRRRAKRRQRRARPATPVRLPPQPGNPGNTLPCAGKRRGPAEPGR